MSMVQQDADFMGDEGKSPLGDVFSAMLDRLESDAQDRVSRRLVVERRWLDDLRQFEGRDQDGIVSSLRRDNRSTAVVNVTRAKCNTFESKLFDMLFPTDDKNWAVDPTPVPEMDMEAQQLTGKVDQMTAAANAEEDDEAAEQAAGEADAMAQRIAEIEVTRQEARQKSDLMSAEIEDNLVECEYAIHCRNVIHDACVTGTGFLKGPIPLSERVRKNWLQDDAGKFRLKMDPESRDRFAYQHTSYWNVYPDNSARHFGQVESWMERHIMRSRDLREMAKQPGVDKEAIRRLLQEGPNETLPQHIIDLDTVAEEEQSSLGDKYWIMWEYRGPTEPEELQEVMAHMMKDREPAADGEDEEDFNFEIDPLMQMDAVVWFCQGEIVRLGITHMDNNDPIYSVFQIEKSVARLWTVGVPHIMRTQARVLNDAWRAMMDNAEFASFPQIEIDTNVIQRSGGGQNIIEPRAVWERTSSAGEKPGILTHDIPIHQEYYAAIIEMAMQFTDTETNVSVLASGEAGAQAKTAGGMALLMNSVNVVFRRVVKNWDDGITTPAVTRAYYFLMQFSDKDEIKGDYGVQARGSSVLLVREIQAQNLLLLATQASANPVLGAFLKMRPLLKKLLMSMMIASDDVLKTEAELRSDEAARQEAEQNAPPDPDMVKMQLERELAMVENETKMALAQMGMEGDMMKMAAQGQITLEEVSSKLQAIRAQLQSKERIFAAEAAIEARKPPTGGGSGGYLSA